MNTNEHEFQILFVFICVHSWPIMKLHVPKEQAGQRLDHFLQQQCPDYSRSRLQGWIKDGRVLINGCPERASRLLREGGTIEVDPAARAPLNATPEDIPLTVLYEDDDMVAIDKAAGMGVHAVAGGRSGTLGDALGHRFES